MLTVLKEEFNFESIDITKFPITLDSWFVSDELKLELHKLGFKSIIYACKGNYVFKIANQSRQASDWKKEVFLTTEQWGIDVPACRLKGWSPTFGDIVLCLEEKSTTKTYYLMDFSEAPHRGAEIWHIWKQHHLVEFFWK